MHEDRVSRNDPCPCGSGKKYKNCCHIKDVEGDARHPESTITDLDGKPRNRPQFPFGTVALYGPDDKTTTKIAAGVIKSPNQEPIIERWVATDVMTSPKVQSELKAFFEKHGVKSVAMSSGNMGCPHEEGADFPDGEDCPFCPFWAGKQGSNQRF
jgi:hypothetical protein